MPFNHALVTYTHTNREKSLDRILPFSRHLLLDGGRLGRPFCFSDSLFRTGPTLQAAQGRPVGREIPACLPGSHGVWELSRRRKKSANEANNITTERERRRSAAVGKRGTLWVCSFVSNGPAAAFFAAIINLLLGQEKNGFQAKVGSHSFVIGFVSFCLRLVKRLPGFLFLKWWQNWLRNLFFFSSECACGPLARYVSC